jgi:phosphatidylglycerophosphate synthase
MKSNNQKSKDAIILLDARATFGKDPIALFPILGRPWLATFLDMFADAEATSRVIVITDPEYKADIERVVIEHQHGEGVSVITENPNYSGHLYVTVEKVYFRYFFVRAIKRGNSTFGRAILGSLDSPADMKIAEEMASRESAGHRTKLVHYFYRPLGRRLAELATRIGITPNPVTLTSLITIPVSATFIALDNYVLGLAAAALLQLFFVLDVTDGMLARITHQRSNFGYWFDTMVDTIHDSAMAVAFSIGAVISTGNIWMTIPGAIWIVSMRALGSNHLIEMAAEIEDKTADIKSAPEQYTNKKSSRLFSAIRIAKNVKLAISQPEIILTIFTVGLVFDAEVGIVIMFASIHLFSAIRMFQLAYIRYRKDEIMTLSHEKE